MDISHLDEVLFLITARGGSKGVPGKNIKLLNGKPLLYYTIDAARQITSDRNICLSSDSEEIIRAANNYGLEVPFVRPDELATDKAGSYDVLLHAVEYYRSIGRNYKTLVLLQPTSPFRNGQHIAEALALYFDEIDMVVSVRESDENPYYSLFEEGSDGYLVKVKQTEFRTRQECPAVYCYNGAIYVINMESLLEHPLSSFKKIKKYIMSKTVSIDIDTMLDWYWAEFLIEKKLV